MCYYLLHVLAIPRPLVQGSCKVVWWFQSRWFHLPNAKILKRMHAMITRDEGTNCPQMHVLTQIFQRPRCRSEDCCTSRYSSTWILLLWGSRALGADWVPSLCRFATGVWWEQSSLASWAGLPRGGALIGGACTEAMRIDEGAKRAFITSCVGVFFRHPSHLTQMPKKKKGQWWANC